MGFYFYFIFPFRANNSKENLERGNYWCNGRFDFALIPCAPISAFNSNLHSSFNQSRKTQSNTSSNSNVAVN